jgi:hypothetical protein
VQPVNQREHGASFTGVPLEHLGHEGRFDRVGSDAGRIAWPVGIGPVAVGRARPRQQLSALELVKPAAAGAFGDQCAFILCDGATDLQQELVLRVVRERPIRELDPAPLPLKFLQQQNLMDVISREAVGFGDQDQIELRQRGCVAEAVETGTAQRGSGNTVIAEHVLLRQLPLLLLHNLPEAFELLVDGEDLDADRFTGDVRRFSRSPDTLA